MTPSPVLSNACDKFSPALPTSFCEVKASFPARPIEISEAVSFNWLAAFSKSSDLAVNSVAFCSVSLTCLPKLSTEVLKFLPASSTDLAIVPAMSLPALTTPSLDSFINFAALSRSRCTWESCCPLSLPNPKRPKKACLLFSNAAFFCSSNTELKKPFKDCFADICPVAKFS